jgi:hypothetical protein
MSGSGGRTERESTMGLPARYPSRMHRLFLACLLGAAGCIDLDDFPSESIVTGPRVLAVVAEPPEVTPGNSLSVSTLVVDADEVEIEYRICGTFDGPFGGAQFGERDEEDCGERALLRGSGPTWVVPADALAAFWSNADLIEAVLGGTLSVETIDVIRNSVGIPLLIEITIQADGKELRAVKRVLLSENPEPHANPPPPAFDYGKLAVIGDLNETWNCTSAKPLIAKPNARIELAPAVTDGTESWVEPYRVINARGEIEEREEREFYSWFATGGDFESHLTRAPLRNQVWTAPGTPGGHRLWLVVRDGHGGESACGINVSVKS